jgi:hypothetical protein
MLQKSAHYNDLSPQLRKQLEERIATFGSTVRYKFDIGRDNPDPLKYGGSVVYPFLYTLDPGTFDIVDEKQRKKVGIVKEVDNKGIPTSFIKIRLKDANKGILELRNDPEYPDDLDKIYFLELHPKNKGGLFAKADAHQVFTRIDEKKYNEEKRTERTARMKAMNVAMEMSEKDIRAFADAMIWDSNMEEDMLRGLVEGLAESSPELFNDLVGSKNLEYQAAIKQATDKKIIAFDPAEYKFIWSANQQIIARLQPSETKNEIEVLSSWMQTAGNQGDEVYKKIQSLLKK